MKGRTPTTWSSGYCSHSQRTNMSRSIVGLPVDDRLLTVTTDGKRRLGGVPKLLPGLTRYNCQFNVL